MRTPRILTLVAVLGLAALGFVALLRNSVPAQDHPPISAGQDSAGPGSTIPPDAEPPDDVKAQARLPDAQPAASVLAGSPSMAAAQGRTGQLVKATFASGCFWCTESDFDKVPGVIATTSGYTGGTFPNPTYEQVSSGGTGHAESVELLFDPAVVSYEQLLDHYWHNVDPFNSRGQFCDFGEQYRPVIFVHDAAQRAAAEASRTVMQRRFSKPIGVAIADAGVFYPAEEYHQDFHNKSSIRYKYYRWGCGRDARLAEIWRAPSAD